MSVAWPAGPIRLAGKTVSRLGFGTMRLTGPGTWGHPRAFPLSMPRPRAVSKLPEQAGHRTLIGPGCLSTGLVAHPEAGAICRLEAAPLPPQPDPG